ncbi:hypothetical protein BLOT_015432 [Blomia tropicalis]|nr:hypothetical protein BLOT_015432 [Blomia tropicalis]
MVNESHSSNSTFKKENSCSKGRPNQDAKYQEYRKSRKNEFNHDIKHMYQKKKKRKRFQLFGNFTKNYKFL